MNHILLTEFGSIVYGTNLPTSDTDYKSIFIPEPRDILLQRAPRTINQTTKLDKNSRNTSDDVDTEHFSAHEYLKLLCEGQSVALDMLYTPKEWYKKSNYIWEAIVADKEKFLSRDTIKYISYARHQAAKYGIKGTRVAAMRTMLDMLNACPVHHVKLSDLIFIQQRELPPSEHISIVEINGPKGLPEPHLQVCGRKIPFHARVDYAIKCFQKIFDEYGARALLAEKNEGIDWKATMHAVRVCHQGKELLTTGHITFPRPEAPLLLQIRKGELPYAQVAELIENGLEELEKIKLTSTLPDKPDYEYANDFIEEIYRDAVYEKYYEIVDELDFI